LPECRWRYYGREYRGHNPPIGHRQGPISNVLQLVGDLGAVDPLPTEPGALGAGLGGILIGGENAQLLLGVNLRLVGAAAGSVSSVTSPFWTGDVTDVELVKVMSWSFLARPEGSWLRQVSHVSLTDRAVANGYGTVERRAVSALQDLGQLSRR
jgi:hypothetical protein